MSGKITGNEPTVAVPSAPTPDGAVSSASLPAASTPGRHVFAGRYEILGLVGSGGMGTVYRARDSELDEIVALKLLRREVMDQSGMLDRFRQEVKLARRVTHRNVARTYDIGESEGDKFLTMEFVEGEARSARLTREGALPARCRDDGGGRDLRGSAGGARGGRRAPRPQAGQRAPRARRAGRGHRLRDRAGALRGRRAREVTMGLALGTPAYMAPEQVEGATDLDERADIYALGAMLYECVTGERAWSGETIWALAAARLMQPPPDPRVKRPDLPTAAAELVLRCMARRRDDRFASTAQVAAALASMTMPAQRSRPSVPPLAPAPIDSDAKTVAVLPFQNLGAPGDDYVADGLSDDLLDALSMTPGLRVLARGAVAKYRGETRDARNVGRDLRVQVVVDGSVRRAGDMLRVSARVVSVADGFQLWAKRFDRPEKEVLTMSDEAANAIAEALTARRTAPARAAPSDARAVDLYLRARHAFRRGWREDTKESIALFEQALALAPDDPTILAGYARAQLRRFLFDTEASDALEAEVKGRTSAERALALAPRLGEAHAALANLKWMMGDHVGCARDLREAIRIAPGSQDVNELYGRLLLEAGRPERAVDILAAAAALDSTLDITNGDLMRARVFVGDWTTFDAGLEREPTTEAQASLHFFLFARLASWRRDKVAASMLRRQVEKRRFALHDEVLRILGVIETDTLPDDMQQQLAVWGRVIGRARRRPMFFRQLAAEMHAYVREDAATVHAIGEADGLGLIDVTWLDRCPLFAPIRDAPLFVAVRDRIAARAREALDVLEGRVE
jgi:TolB-like protein/Tfp pilus assembly protein PilF